MSGRYKRLFTLRAVHTSAQKPKANFTQPKVKKAAVLKSLIQRGAK